MSLFKNKKTVKENKTAQGNQAVFTEVDLADCQGLLVRGYGQLPHAQFLVLTINEGAAAKATLSQWIDTITRGNQKPLDSAMNIAFTHEGLVALDLEGDALESFADTFRAGMTTSHKQRMLGDIGESAPEHWLWGGDAHVVVMIYGKTQSELADASEAFTTAVNGEGLTVVFDQVTETLPDGKEHFGFRDGIAQPYIREFDRQGKLAHQEAVPLGEFVLGYSNGYELQTRSPKVRASDDTQDLLQVSAEESGYHDLGRNGSYLVVRQLEQDVPGFWQSMQDLSQQTQQQDPIYLASKMVGRWPNGVPLVMSPDAEPTEVPDDLDDFMYQQEDADGLRCPLGAHIRRTHPRDSLPPEPGSEKSIEFSNRHRLLRRGRPYGKPVDSSMLPQRFLEALGNNKKVTNDSRGLMFVAFNANIERQFEFVQHTWSNNPNFNGLYQEPDPIIGTRDVVKSRREQLGQDDQPESASEDHFTIQGCPMHQRVSGMPNFVSMKGGGYFFMPSLSALKFLLSAKA